MASFETELGSAELEVLRTLWETGPTTVREVMNHLHARGRTVAYTTVLTFLTRLEQKGCVASDKSGPAYVYRPTVTREKVSKSRVGTLLEELYDGAAGALALQLVREGGLGAEEIDEMRRLIDALDEAPAKKRSRGRKAT